MLNVKGVAEASANCETESVAFVNEAEAWLEAKEVRVISVKVFSLLIEELDSLDNVMTVSFGDSDVFNLNDSVEALVNCEEKLVLFFKEAKEELGLAMAE